MRGPDHRKSSASRAWWSECGLLALLALLALPLFTPRVYASDEIKYFSMLRSIYFDRDLQYANEYDAFIARDPVAHAGLVPFRDTVTPTGRRLNDAPIGTALLWAPFYVAADGAVGAARALGATVPRDGYSWPYVWAVCLASLIWGMAGLALTYRLCRAYAGPHAAFWSVTALWFASPVVFYLYITPAMSHACSLFTVSLFLWTWHRTRTARTPAGWVALALSSGLMVLVRELNWLLLLVVGVDELISLARAVRSEGPVSPVGVAAAITQRGRGYLTFVVVVAVVVAPQFAVYRALNGTFGPTPFVVQKFSLLPVHAIEVLLSGFHGLFTWHPITLVAVMGLAVLARRAPVVAAAFAAVFAVQVMVIGSYDTWWGGASFGARRFINVTTILAVGLAALLDSCRGRVARTACAGGIVLLIIWNFGLAVQYSIGLIPRDQPVRMAQIVRNQFFEVPPRIARIAWRFTFDRASLYRTQS